jgi:hypothetical protein
MPQPRPPHYIPPAFPLYEFSPEVADRRGAGGERRWFAHWDGLVGEPAREVILAWSRGTATVSVCTSGDAYEPKRARFRAAHLALGGTLLPVPRRPPDAGEIAREMARLRDDDRCWTRYTGLLPDATYAEAASCDGYDVAYSLFGDGAVFVTAVGVPAQRFRIRVAAG